MAVDEQIPTLMPSLYPCSKPTDSRPYPLLDDVWRGFSYIAHDKTPDVNGVNIVPCLFLPRERGHLPRRGPVRPIMGGARTECRPNRLRGRRDQAIIQLVCPSMMHLTLELTIHLLATRRASFCRRFRR